MLDPLFYTQKIKCCDTCFPFCKKRPSCCKPECHAEKPCPCVKKIKAVEDDLKNVKADVAKNTQKIQQNYNQLTEAIGDLAEQHAQDCRNIYNYIDEKDAENDYLLEQEVARAKAAESDLNDRLNQEIADRTAADDTERAERIAADNQEKAERITADDNEREERIAGDNNLQTNINILNQKVDDNEQDIEDKLAAEIAARIAGDNNLQNNINILQQKHDQDIQNMNDHLDDILGIDAEGVSEIKAILEDDDTTTGLITELARKANKNNTAAGTYTKVTVNNEGIVTSGSNPTTLADAGITNAYTKAEVDALISGLTTQINILKSYWSLNSNTNRLETSYVIEPLGYK